MSTTTKSPRRALLFAHAVGEMVLPAYAHKYSPQKFTLSQLFACLVLKEFLRFDYRKLEAFLRDAPELVAAIELKTVPDHSTFQKAAKRLLNCAAVERLLSGTLELARFQGRLGARSELAALDGTGWESRHASRYFVSRRAKGLKTRQDTTYRRFPKAGVLCDCRSHLILSIVPSRGPSPDVPHFRRVLDDALSRKPITTLLADAGYDGEHVHEYAREECGVNTFIPAKIGRPTRKKPSGYWRRRMASRLHLSRYGQRWQVETVNSMLKRLLGSALRARSYHSQCRELRLRALTLNVLILRRGELFDRAGLVSLLTLPRRKRDLMTCPLYCSSIRGWPRQLVVVVAQRQENPLAPTAHGQQVVLRALRLERVARRQCAHVVSIGMSVSSIRRTSADCASTISGGPTWVA